MSTRVPVAEIRRLRKEYSRWARKRDEFMSKHGVNARYVNGLIMEPVNQTVRKQDRELQEVLS